MYKTRINRRDYYRKKFSIGLSFVGEALYGANQDKKMSKYKARVQDITKAERGVEDTYVGDYVFELLLKKNLTRLYLMDIKPINMTETNIAHKELMFDLLLHVAKNKFRLAHETNILIASSYDCFIQEALIANGFKLQTRKDSKTGLNKFSGIWSIANVY